MANKIVKDLNQGSVTKTMILFAMPMLFAGVIQMLYNTADMIIVGRFVGTSGLAAVSVGGDVMHFLAFAAAIASKTTDAGSEPSSCRTKSTFALSAHMASCSAAAARNVSAAARRTFFP